MEPGIELHTILGVTMLFQQKSSNKKILKKSVQAAE